MKGWLVRNSWPCRERGTVPDVPWRDKSASKLDTGTIEPGDPEALLRYNLSGALRPIELEERMGDIRPYHLRQECHGCSTGQVHAQYRDMCPTSFAHLVIQPFGSILSQFLTTEMSQRPRGDPLYKSHEVSGAKDGMKRTNSPEANTRVGSGI